MMTSVEMPHKDVPPPLELVKSRIEELLPPAAREEIDSGDVAVIDVRDPERFASGHLQGAVSLSAGESARAARESEYAAAVDEAIGGRERRVILYCGEGNRSARAADALRNEHGFERAASIIGGVKLWSELGLPVEGEVVIGDEESETQLEGEEDTT